MLATDTTTLSDIIIQCFDYSMDGRFSPTQRSAFLVDGKRLRGLLLNLLSARFAEGTQAVLDANKQLTRINEELANSAETLAHTAEVLGGVATLVANLDKLLSLATSFL
ncbi:MAG TPA: hypothetical protein VK525_04990 [Candidatus Saccharimonadales bacterium]|jgi:hypothetical protein|nr:hypothetical protein [Candidatus Saccharimonadales bacterium]